MALPQLKLVMIACFKSCETRVAPENEFGDFTTLLVICPDDSTGIELNPQPTAPLPREGFGMNFGLDSEHLSSLLIKATRLHDFLISNNHNHFPLAHRRRFR